MLIPIVVTHSFYICILFNLQYYMLLLFFSCIWIFGCYLFLLFFLLILLLQTFFTCLLVNRYQRILWGRIIESYGVYIFVSAKQCQIVFSKLLYHFTLLLAVYKSSDCFISFVISFFVFISNLMGLRYYSI